MKKLESLFDLSKLKEKLTEINEKVNDSNLWDNPDKAKELLIKKKSAEDSVLEYESIGNEILDIETLIELLEEEESSDFEEEIKELNTQLKDVDEKLSVLKIKILLKGKYDSKGAIVSIHAGTGGVDAMDWSNMLYRMYVRYCEKKGFKVTVVEYQDDTEAGIKSATLIVEGENAYGYLKNEHGVHRLVRISPFNAAGKRQTSFALVEVTPQVDDDFAVSINPEDLRIDTYRSSGAGGQHVNTTDSAIRITHIPTNVVVTCQNERSQHQNKEVAMKLLGAKLAKLKEEEHKENLNELKGDFSLITWGAQIRSYVFQPYTMVKDHRTGAEKGNVDAVMDGDLEYFISEKLKEDSKEEGIK